MVFLVGGWVGGVMEARVIGGEGVFYKGGDGVYTYQVWENPKVEPGGAFLQCRENGVKTACEYIYIYIHIEPTDHPCVF